MVDSIYSPAKKGPEPNPTPEPTKPAVAPVVSGWWAVVIVIAIAIGLALAMLGCATPASAQTNSAAVRTADAAQPEASAMFFADYTSCVRDLVDLGDKIKDAKKACADVRDRAARQSEKMANEAADATKNNWPQPVVVADGCGYGCGGGGG